MSFSIREPLHDALMACPVCEVTGGLHADTVVVESAAGTAVTVSASGEGDDSSLSVRHVADPAGAGQKPLQDHRISIVVWCEVCGRRTVVSFQQHSSSILVSTKMDLHPYTSG